jgi:hypothetical protein
VEQLQQPTSDVAAPPAHENLQSNGLSSGLMALVVLIIIGLGGVGIYTFRPIAQAQPVATVAPLPTAVPATPLPQPTALPVSPTPSCTARAWIETIHYHEQRGDWGMAAANAEAALNDPALCPSIRESIAQLLITNSLNTIYYAKFLPQDTNAQYALLDRYRSIKRRAAILGVPFPTALQIATQAYSIGQFLLAKTAFEEAFNEGSFTKADQSLLQQYASTLFNLGVWWSSDKNSPMYTQGLRLLQASYAIDVQYGTGFGEAEAKLRELLGDDTTNWPEPAETPLLTQSQGS